MADQPATESQGPLDPSEVTDLPSGWTEPMAPAPRRPLLYLPEFLVVCLAAIILVAIIIPPGGEPIGRAKAGRAQSDMRAFERGLNSFYLDHGRLPAWATGRFSESINHHDLASSNLPTFRVVAPVDGDPATYSLTTPISYITTYFLDPFSIDEVQPKPGVASQDTTTLIYFATEHGYILGSRGPDGDFDAPYFRYEGRNHDLERRRFSRYTYDPTNGSESGGDVIHISSGLPVKQTPNLLTRATSAHTPRSPGP